MKIKDIKSRWILDSRGNPTVEADVILDGGQIGRAAVPSGASTGKHEAIELRDNSEEFGGQGVSLAINNIQKLLKPVLIGSDASDQVAIDKKMLMIDGTKYVATNALTIANSAYQVKVESSDYKTYAIVKIIKSKK